jgi:tripartite-type tricarboxylate transporter receptor subunit TctC
MMCPFARLLLVLALSGAVTSALAQSFPSRPVRLIVPFAPGGGADLIARLIAQEFGKAWAHNMVVENRAGAGGTIGTDAVAKAAPDGHTLLFATMAANGVAPSLYAKIPYNSERDFAYIAPLTRAPSVLLVNANVPVNTLKELADLARKQPGKLTYASPGAGLSGHLGMELILRSMGVDVLSVHYKGAAPASQAMAVGETNMTLDLIPTGVNYVKSGKAKALAVTSQARLPQLPDVPPLNEAIGLNLVLYTWQGLAAPAGTPKEAITKIHQDLQGILGNAELRERLERMGSEPFSMSPEAFTQYVAAEIKRWAEVVRQTGAKAD